MPSQREENIVVADERAPLLGNNDTRSQDRIDEASDGEESIQPEKETSRTWEYVWKACLTILAILVIAVFVKGWIDADDVNVSFSPCFSPNTTLII